MTFNEPDSTASSTANAARKEDSALRQEVWQWWMNIRYIANEQWRALVGGALVGLGLVLFLYFFSTRVYESKAVFVVEQSPFLFESNDKLANIVNSGKDPLINFLASIRTVNMASDVAESLRVSQKNISIDDVMRSANISKPKSANIEISSIADSRIGVIRVESSDPQFAADTARAALEELELLNPLAGRLNNIDSESQLTEAKLATLNQSLSAITADRIRVEQQINMLDEYIQKGGDLAYAPPFADDASLNEMLRRETELKTSLQAQASISVRGTTLDTLQAAVTSIDAQIASYSQQLALRLHSTYNTEVAEEGALQANLQDIQGELNTLENERTHLTRAVGDAHLRRELVGKMPGKVTKDGDVVVVMDPPTVPTRFIRPSRPLFAVFALLFSAGLGLGCGFLAHFLDRHVRTPQQMDFRSDIPCLAVLPNPDVEAAKLNSHSPLIDQAAQPGLSFLRNLMIRAALTQQQGRVFVFTGAGKGENHALWVSRLAVLLAKGQQRTLVVDLDFKKPEVAEILGISPTRTLVEWFQGDEPLQDFIQYSVLQELAVLHPGRSTEPEEFLISRRPLSTSLMELSEQWDFILIISPSLSDDFQLLLAAPPASILITVARYGVTTLDDISTTINLSETYGLQFAGVVLYDYPPRLLEGPLAAFSLGTHQYMLRDDPSLSSPLEEKVV